MMLAVTAEEMAVVAEVGETEVAVLTGEYLPNVSRSGVCCTR